MKRNPQDRYSTVEGTLDWIEDAETHEQLLFIIDEENQLVFRSFLEEDIKPFIQLDDITSTEKRRKMRILYQLLPKEDSQKYYFAIEKIVEEKETDNWDEIYGLKRIPIGYGVRTTEETALEERKGEPSIETRIYTGYENMSVNVSNIIMKVADIFGIKVDGMPKIIPC